MSTFEIKRGDVVATACGQSQVVRHNDPLGVRSTIVCQEHGGWEPIMAHFPLVEGLITSHMTPREAGQEVIRVLGASDAYDTAKAIVNWYKVAVDDSRPAVADRKEKKP